MREMLDTEREGPVLNVGAHNSVGGKKEITRKESRRDPKFRLLGDEGRSPL